MSRTSPVRIVGAGDNVADRYREVGTYYPGGNPVNVAVWARRNGAESGYIGVVGTDDAGNAVLEALRVEGVDSSRVRVAEGPNAYAEVDLVDGERVFIRSNKGVSRFPLDAGDLEYVSTFDLVHVGEFGCLEAQIPALARRALVSFDIGHQREPEYLDALLPHLEVACFSARQLDDDETAALLADARRRGARIAFATRGERDALLDDGARLWRQPPVVAYVVDTMGAGDAFTAGFLVAYLAGEPHDAALAAAARTAAAACQATGGFGHPHPFTPEQLDRELVLPGEGKQ